MKLPVKIFSIFTISLSIIVSNTFLPSFAQEQGACLQVGDTASEHGVSLVQTRDGGYAVVGNSGYPMDNYYIAKLDSNAILQWGITISDSGTGEVRDIIQTTDGGYALTGFTQGAFGMQDQDVLIIKLDSTGNLQWAKNIGDYGYQKYEKGNSVIQCKDGGYAIVGDKVRIDSLGSGDYNFYLVKLDKLGNLQWTRIVGDESSDYGYSIIQTEDGSFIIGGIGAYIDSIGNKKGGSYIVKFDSMGSVKWDKYFLGNYNRKAYIMIQTTDGGFALTGLTYGVFGQPDVLVMKLDSEGNVEWSRVIGEEHWQEGASIFQSRDGGFVVAGFSWEFSIGYPDMLLFKLDALGNMQWLQTAGFHLPSPWSPSAAYDIIQNSKGEFIITGSGNTFDGDTLYGEGMSIVKITEEGELCCKFWPRSGIAIDTPIVKSGGFVVDSGGTVRDLPVTIIGGGKVQLICGSFTTAIGTEETKSVQKEPLISPNPSQGNFTLYSPFSVSNVFIYNVLGEKLYTLQVGAIGEKNNLATNYEPSVLTLDISFLHQGIYFIKTEVQNNLNLSLPSNFWQMSKIIILK